MSRPDPARIRRNALDVIGNAGETATVRQYVSGVTGTPKFGAATTFNYIERVVTGLFASTLFGAPRPNERDLAGGQAQNADMLFTTESASARRMKSSGAARPTAWPARLCPKTWAGACYSANHSGWRAGRDNLHEEPESHAESKPQN